MRHTVPYLFILSLFLTANSLFAQVNASKQPLPTFKYKADNTTDTSRQYKVVPNKETKAVSVCAVWNLTDTAEQTLWSMADSSGKVAAKAGGKAVRAGVPAVRTDIAGLPRKARKRPLTFTMGGDSVSRDALLEVMFYPYALTQQQRVAAETYLALKYGVTLREDYLSPEGDTLWNHTYGKSYNPIIDVDRIELPLFDWIYLDICRNDTIFTLQIFLNKDSVVYCDTNIYLCNGWWLLVSKGKYPIIIQRFKKVYPSAEYMHFQGVLFIAEYEVRCKQMRAYNNNLKLCERYFKIGSMSFASNEIKYPKKKIKKRILNAMSAL